MDDPVFQPVKTAVSEQLKALAPKLILAAAAIAIVAAAYFYRPQIEEAMHSVTGYQVSVQSDDDRVAELNQHLKEYRSLAMQLAAASGQRRSDLLDRRTILVGRINTLIDLIPPNKLPADAERFTLLR